MPIPPRLVAVLAATLAIPLAALAQKPFKPEVGQQGKDVIWVPTPQPLVEKMLDMAKATPKDYVMDLGSGDGRLVITAARRGIRALGVEYDPNMVALSRLNARQAGVGERAKFVRADLFKTDLQRATVITMFLLPEINMKLRPRILELKPGTRIVSNSFDMGDWLEDETATLSKGDGCDISECVARLWIVPARVAGTHKTGHGELTLEQTFQKLKGTLRTAGREVPVEGKVVGREVVLVAEGRTFRGEMKGRQLALDPGVEAPKVAAAEKPYEPSVGQPGKDVVWVPTPQVLVDKMLDIAKATPKDYVIDLGSGDGRLVITAAKRGIRAHGIEYEPKMVELSRRNAQQEGVTDRATFVEADIFQTDFSRATVITMFLLPHLNLKLRPLILNLEPGTRIVSNSFDMDDWEADETAVLDTSTGCDSAYCTARLWIVPAKVGGTHKTGQGDLTLEQSYQNVKGTLRRDGKDIPVMGRVAGREVTLLGEGRMIRGEVKGVQLVLQ